jgi:N-methylhydantoinase B
MINIDQVTLSILVNNLYWVAEEMNAYLTKAAYSTNIKVRKDCSCAIYTRNGDMVAQGEFIPVHLGVMSQTLKEVLKVYPSDTMKDGDVIIHNDPYMMGSHLWDVMLFQPVFYKGDLIAFVGNLAHHVDIGGSSLSKCLPTIFEEGLRFSPIKLYKEGAPQEDIFKIIANNVRTPYEVKGDLAAQTAANYRGVQRLTELADKFGADTLLEYFEAILTYSEKGMREAVKNLPDAEEEFEDYVENDGIEDGLYKIKVKLQIKGDELYFDFKGSSKPGRGGVNSPWSLTHSAVFYAVKSVLGSSIPTNQGAYRPIHLIRPEEESMLDAKFPHAVGTCTCIPGQRIVDVIIGAFSKIMPEKTCACDGNWCSATFVGLDPRTGRYSAYTEAYGCGRGAKYNDDGADAHQSHLTNTANAPVEIIELEHPLKVDKYALVPDSGGAGKFRGGVGLTREVTMTADMSATAQSNRLRIGPYGLFGGGSGKTDYCVIELSDGKKVPTAMNVEKGNKVVIRTSGGGGWGNPLEREIEKIEWDVLNGYISAETAEKLYKVAVDPITCKADREKTSKLRCS